MDLIVSVPDERVSFVKKLLRELNLPARPVQAKKKAVSTTKAVPLTAAQQEWVDGLKEALEEVRLAEEGKIQLKSAYDLLDEL